MTIDYRALCAELLAAADEYAGMNPYMRLDNAMKAARAALAAEPVPPDAGEVAELVAELNDAVDGAMEMGWETAGFAMRRAADILSRLAPQPVPEGPSDEELTLTYAYAVAAAVDNKRGPFKNEDAEAAQLAGLRAVLARWGQAPNA